MKESILDICRRLGLNSEQFEVFLKFKISDMLAKGEDAAQLDYPGLNGRLRRTGSDRVKLDVMVLSSGAMESFEIDVDRDSLPEVKR